MNAQMEDLKNASAAAGFVILMGRKGGSVNAQKAANLFDTTGRTTESALLDAGRRGLLIGARDREGQLLFPVWQFALAGGLLPGMAEVLVRLSQHTKEMVSQR